MLSQRWHTQCAFLDYLPSCIRPPSMRQILLFMSHLILWHPASFPLSLLHWSHLSSHTWVERFMWSNPCFHSSYIWASLLTVIKVRHLMRLLCIWLGMDYCHKAHMQLWIWAFFQFSMRKKHCSIVSVLKVSHDSSFLFLCIRSLATTSWGRMRKAVTDTV